MKNNLKWIILFLAPATLLFLFVYAIPIAVLFATSFTDWTIGAAPKFRGLVNYYDLLANDGDFIKAVLNTTVWILLQSTVHVALGVLCALILARKKFYWKFTRTVFMLPNIISSAALGMMFLMLFNATFGAVNSIIRALGFRDFGQNWFLSGNTAFLTVTLTWLPFAATITILVLAEMTSIEPSIMEAARIDGANELQTNVRIVLPMMRNIIGTSTVLAATSMLQKLDIIMMTTSGGPGNTTLNLPMYVYETALRNNDFGRANTAGVYMIIIGLVAGKLINKIYKMGETDA
jgi:raffinose/stachyose/melibiose transport system permease protein